MESPRDPSPPSTPSDDKLSLSDIEEPPSPSSAVLARINQLEQQLYSCYSDVQQKLEQCEKTLQSVVSKVFNDVKTANVESFDAVQLDLELLRQKVRNREIELTPENPVRFIDELSVESLVVCSMSIDVRKVTNYLTNNLKFHFKLPSLCLIPQSENSPQVDNSILFEAAGTRADTGGALFPFEELLREKEERAKRRASTMEGYRREPICPPASRTPPPEHGYKSPPALDESLSPRTLVVPRSSNTMRTILVASLCAGLISLLFQLLPSLLRN